jgi:hypothetical protein
MRSSSWELVVKQSKKLWRLRSAFGNPLVFVITFVSLGPAYASNACTDLLRERKIREQMDSLDGYCKHLSSRESGFKLPADVETRVKNYLKQGDRILATRKMLDRRCLYGTGFATALNGIYFLSSMNRTSESGWWAQHNSNFTQGLSALAGIHNCLADLDPRGRRKILVGLVGSNVAANVLFEKNRERRQWRSRFGFSF